jgi:2-oxoglutarate dehydrogenase E1 component
MGFEYGYSVNYPEALVMWEAQFGDFVNGGQVIIDQFLVSAESKWGQRSGLVLLLPHGFEGQGPEHSSARLERFLQMAANGNIRVCYPTTPAQYFHLLRRQAKLSERKPLVVMTPKSLLRHPACVSAVDALTDGAFRPVIASRTGEAVERIVICSGKVFYDLETYREKHETAEAAVIRLEQLYPFPEHALRDTLRGLDSVHDVVWVQEEPRNMGAWDFVRPYLREWIPGDATLRYVGRPAGGSPATGSAKRHAREQERLLREAMASSTGEVASAKTD